MSDIGIAGSSTGVSGLPQDSYCMYYNIQLCNNCIVFTIQISYIIFIVLKSFHEMKRDVGMAS